LTTDELLETVARLRLATETPADYRTAVLDAARSRLPMTDASLVASCDRDAARLHRDQRRGDHSPYIVHPRRVALLCAAAVPSDRQLDAILAALLHDVIEDCGVDSNWIADQYGITVAGIVERLTTIATPDESPVGRRDRKLAKWHRIATSPDPMLATVHLMDVLDNCISLRMVTPTMPAWSKLPRWLWQTIEHQLPIADARMPLAGRLLREEVAHQHGRGVSTGSWMDA